MKKKIVNGTMLVFAIASLVFSVNPSAWAKHEDKAKSSEDTHQGTPPGFDQGKKTGWQGGNKPPGLAKKKHYKKQNHHYPKKVKPKPEPKNEQK